MARTQLLLAAALAFLCCVSASDVYLFDSAGSQFINNGATVQLTRDGVSSVASALLGLEPSAVIDQSAWEQIASVLSARTLAKPAALLSLNLPGLANEPRHADTVSAPFGSRARCHMAMTSASEEDTASAVLDALGDVAVRNRGVAVETLDHTVLQGCDDACMEAELSTLAGAIGAQYTPGATPLMGRLRLASGAELDLEDTPVRLFAVELLGLYASTVAKLRTIQQRKQANEAQKDVEVLESTLVSLQALRNNAAAAGAALEAVTSVVERLVAALDQAYDGQVVYQVGLLEAAPVAGGDVHSLLSWKAAARRRLAETVPLVGDVRQAANATEEELASAFANVATALGSFLIILYFIIAALHCMCFMRFKQDSLLYGRSKAD